MGHVLGEGGSRFLSPPPPYPQQAARDHSAVVALYRSHLLYAIQVSPASASGGRRVGGRAPGGLQGWGGREWEDGECPGSLSAPSPPRPPPPGSDGRRRTADSEPDPTDAEASGSGPLSIRTLAFRPPGPAQGCPGSHTGPPNSQTSLGPPDRPWLCPLPHCPPPSRTHWPVSGPALTVPRPHRRICGPLSRVLSVLSVP